MTIHKTAYDTTACRDYVMGKTRLAIQHANTISTLRGFDNSFVRQVQGADSAETAIPTFSHPVLVELEEKKSHLVVDVRSFGRWHRDQHEFVISNKIEASQIEMRARLTEIWIEKSPSLLRNISALPVIAYASWISEAVRQRFDLTPQEQYQLYILAGYFYLCQFTDEDKASDDFAQRAAMTLSKALRVSATDVLVISDQAGMVKSVTDFCEQAKVITNSVRLQDFTAGLLFTIVGSSWYAANSRELVAVALEHPPTWIAIVFAAMEERTYKKTQIASLVERHASKDYGREYPQAVISLIKNASPA